MPRVRITLSVLLTFSFGISSLQAYSDPTPERTIVTVVLEGDNVSGVGNVSRIDNLAIRNGSDWIVECDTDHADSDRDSVLLRGSLTEPPTLYLREGDALPAPSGATIDSFDTVNLNTLGNSGWNLFLDGTTGGSDDSGIYLNTTLLIQEGDISTSPDFTPGTPYIGFFECKITSGDVILILASVDDPNIGSSVDRALVIYDGGIETVLVKEGDILPGQTEALQDVETGPHDFAFNDAQLAMFVAELEGDSSLDTAIYLHTTLLAQEGSASVVGGRTWGDLGSAVVDVNNLGETVFRGRLDSSDTSNDTILVQDGAKLVQEGDPFGAFVFESFGSGPLDIADNGRVLWYAEWSDPNTDIDTGLFVDDELCIQEGVTTIDGVIIDSLRGVQDGYALSDDGRWVLFEAILANGREGAFLLDLDGPWTDLSSGLAGSGGRVPCLTPRGSLVEGTEVRLELTGALPSSTATLFIGLSQLDAPLLGGILVPFPNFIFGGLPINASGELTLSTIFPDEVPAGLEFFAQFWIVDPGGPQGFSATNGIRGIVP